MVTRSLNIIVDNKEIQVKIIFNTVEWPATESFKAYGLKEENWHTEYDGNYRCAVINWLAPTWYIDLASLFELIYEGHEYQELIPELEDDIFRCGVVEKFIVGIAGEHREDYINARIKMYDDIIEHKAYTLQKNFEAVAYARSTLIELRNTWSSWISKKSTARVLYAGFCLRIKRKNANIYIFAGIAKWSNASDCKSAGFGLRRFDSYSQHQANSPSFTRTFC